MDLAKIFIFVGALLVGEFRKWNVARVSSSFFSFFFFFQLASNSALWNTSFFTPERYIEWNTTGFCDYWAKQIKTVAATSAVFCWTGIVLVEYTECRNPIFTFFQFSFNKTCEKMFFFHIFCWKTNQNSENMFYLPMEYRLSCLDHCRGWNGQEPSL